MQEGTVLLYPKGNQMIPQLAMPYTASQKEDTEYFYMKSLYPPFTKEISRQIDDVCDKMEWDGSTMYDQVPDAVRLRRMSAEITNSCVEQNPQMDIECLSAMVEIMLYNEMFYRRRRRRQHKENMGLTY